MLRTYETVRPPPRAHYRRVNQGLWDAVLECLASVTIGLAGSDDSNPPVYPRDAQARDLERIGADMYAAFETFNQESGPSSTKSTKDVTAQIP